MAHVTPRSRKGHHIHGVQRISLSKVPNYFIF
ncbi:hypothetical protein CY0110_19422 [Crocosphaera chwakensis CCY0110]|uniref:Uncharacterized protein n=1 Tax=Crocosphaera chwakensis CCY0110 TaxID=391612 RepID=A3IJL6_9CHRO|nr:hypothetical protein CY0110_19422 [Crocosphaera chwakensis CCY0110]